MASLQKTRKKLAADWSVLVGFSGKPQWNGPIGWYLAVQCPAGGVYICNKRVVSGIVILACTQRLALFSGGSLGTSKDLKSYE